ncbi:BREX system serine/threonine kinase PglW [Gimesia aquarii]|uniref:Serine/threonine-protein kinase PrkC n=1 Tax=Gimesia aquarii TaxID=2527964 RepID=A0A517VQN9_9PLAN|nr:BREX system serine/threonine kinase PglW [Gimesia aquarii]QDT95269.1 Serine/threonine-protein kinase PrkC [Gimesia aquarii]
MESPRWNIITSSQYEWERRALDFIREGLPDHDPYRAWANFEFHTNDGAIYEVDLLVLTKQGFFLIEIKSWPGRVRGDAGTWTRTTPEGRVISEDNPVLLTNRKAKALSSLLKSQSATKKIRVPWLDAIVFLSADDLHCDLTGPAANRVFLKDRKASESQKERKGILSALMRREGQGIDPELRSTIDAKVARTLAKAIDDSGIRPSQKSRRIGDFVLGELIADGPGYQDRIAEHVTVKNDFRRVRLYTVAGADTEEDRQRRKRAAIREYEIIRSLNHPYVLPVTDYKEHELGPALLFRYADPHSIRFDHYLATQCHKLTTSQRLKFLRDIADVVRYAHRKRVIHRSMSPYSILVMKDDGARTESEKQLPPGTMAVRESSAFDDPSQLYLQVYNWQVGARLQTSVTPQVTEVEDLVDSQALVYMSPEAVADPRRVSEASDIFSLGAIAYHLFTFRPPAGSLSELTHILRDRKGLSVSSVMDGAGAKLEEFIQWSTHPDALTRIGNVEDFLLMLDEVEDELTAPDQSAIIAPLLAKRGDRLDQDFIVKSVLGQGATARALLVTKDDEEFVLKVALTEDDNLRLLAEGEALKKIQSEFIIQIFDIIEIAGKTILVLQVAGEESLAKHLRKYGIPTLDLLSRYGSNLLSAVESLERHGVVHRDIKPDNIGIFKNNRSENQLMLYDFSLTSAPLDNLRIGTTGYTDPFLKTRKSGKWDLAAERYSAGITLYEMTLGHDLLPKWGEEDVANPADTKDELVLDVEKFKPSVREGLTKFFTKALDRDPDKRFDNAKEMRFAWEKVFMEADDQTVITSNGEKVTTTILLDEAELDTLVAALDLSARARDALDSLDITTVKDLLLCSIHEIRLMRGVGDQYRREIMGFITELREKFPDVTAKKTSTTEDDQNPSLERLHNRVVGTRNAKKETEWRVRSGLLNLLADDDTPVDAWPSQSDVADALNETRAKVGQALAADQKRWGKDSFLTAFRHELFEQIQRLGGVVTTGELVDLTILLRPAVETIDTIKQQRLASAIARAAVETEGSLSEPRFEIRRLSGKTVVACTDDLALYSEKLGEVADRIAKADPLLPRLRVFQELYDVTQPPPIPGCQPFSNERLIKLAAAMSSQAAVSSRQELYPHNMESLRSLKLGIGALSGLGLGEKNEGFTIWQVHNRVSSRYPEAMTLPTDPKELELMLRKVGIDVRWESDSEVFRRREAKILVTSGSSIGSRRDTATSTRHVDSTSPETVEARQTEDRLQHAYRDGGFLVLTVKPSYLRPCEHNLVHRFPELERVSFDDLLFEQLRAKSKEYEFPWSDLYEADSEGTNTDDWANLLHLMSEVGPNIETELMNSERPLLLVHPGLIARYQMMSVLQTLRDRVGHDAKCPTVWVLIATDSQNEMPYLDGVQIPLISKGQRAAVSEYWIDNLHRGRTKEITAEKTTGSGS